MKDSSLILAILATHVRTQFHIAPNVITISEESPIATSVKMDIDLTEREIASHAQTILLFATARIPNSLALSPVNVSPVIRIFQDAFHVLKGHAQFVLRDIITTSTTLQLRLTGVIGAICALKR